MTRPMDHDIKIWVDAQTYLAVLAAAKDDDRSVSSYIRSLVRTDLARKASAIAAQSDRDAPGADRPAGDHTCPVFAPMPRNAE